MNVKLGTLVEATQALNELGTAKLPAKAAYRVAKAIEKIGGHVKTFESVRAETIKRYGEEQENGNFMVPQDKVQAFMDELNPLIDEDIELDIHPIDVEMLGDELMMSPASMFQLSFLWETGASQDK